MSEPVFHEPLVVFSISFIIKLLSIVLYLKSNVLILSTIEFDKSKNKYNFKIIHWQVSIIYYIYIKLDNNNTDIDI
jgi:hypothetical protein